MSSVSSSSGISVPAAYRQTSTNGQAGSIANGQGATIFAGKRMTLQLSGEFVNSGWVRSAGPVGITILRNVVNQAPAGSLVSAATSAFTAAIAAPLPSQAIQLPAGTGSAKHGASEASMKVLTILRVLSDEFKAEDIAQNNSVSGFELLSEKDIQNFSQLSDVSERVVAEGVLNQDTKTLHVKSLCLDGELLVLNETSLVVENSLTLKNGGALVIGCGSLDSQTKTEVESDGAIRIYGSSVVPTNIKMKTGATMRGFPYAQKSSLQ